MPGPGACVRHLFAGRTLSVTATPVEHAQLRLADTPLARASRRGCTPCVACLPAVRGLLVLLCSSASAFLLRNSTAAVVGVAIQHSQYLLLKLSAEKLKASSMAAHGSSLTLASGLRGCSDAHAAACFSDSSHVIDKQRAFARAPQSASSVRKTGVFRRVRGNAW